MEISKVTGFKKERVPVCLIKEGGRIEKHPFFKFLNAPQKAYIVAFQKKSPVRNTHNHLVFMPGGGEILLIGVQSAEKFNHRKALLAARRVIAVSRREKIKHIVVNLEDFLGFDASRFRDNLGELLATQFEIANFEFVHYKEKPKGGWFFVESIFVSGGNTNAEDLSRGQIIGEEINKARVLSNMPGSDMTPIKLAESAIIAGKAAGFKVNILDEAKIKKLGMGGVIGVSKGSDARPRFIIIEYFKGPKGAPPVVLVGKGVTFDTGGLNLKPEKGIYEMHMDMSGGAAVIHTIASLARIKAKVNVVGLVPAVENMPSGSSYRPGDLLKTMSGKTIEVLNTDAEGRIILADALTYALSYRPSLIVDVATLTGAAEVALGRRASAIFATSHELEDRLRDIGEKTMDLVWPLPLWEEYEEEIAGTFGDIANLGRNDRYGGAITGAVFLWQFVKDVSRHGSVHVGQSPAWAHIDIAPRMTSIEGDFLSKGAAGASINLLVHFLKSS